MFHAETLLADIAVYAKTYLAGLFLDPGSLFFVGTLASALAIATAHMVRRRLRKGRKVRLRTILAGLFPAKMLRHRSTRADIIMLFINTLLTGLLIGWAIVSFGAVSAGVRGALTALLGAPAPTTLPDWATRSLATGLYFLAYEFGYWLDHTLKHRVRILWEFHKVHHSAEHLTPLTAFRMHPIDSWLFANIVAVSVGAVAGVYAWAMGGSIASYTINGNNVLLVMFIYLYIHLQHSEVWIPFTGWWGKVFMSPAHHQVHHSRSARHYDKNMGSCLAVWDWLFGTLYMPAKDREAFRFGVQAKGRDMHEMGEALLGPFRDVADHLRPEAPPQTQPAAARASEKTHPNA